MLNPIQTGLFGAPQDWGGDIFIPLSISATTNGGILKFGTKIVHHKRNKKIAIKFSWLPWRLADVIKNFKFLIFKANF